MKRGFMALAAMAVLLSVAACSTAQSSGDVHRVSHTLEARSHNK